jgi:uncharacterized protein (DUF58 family)
MALDNTIDMASAERLEQRGNVITRLFGDEAGPSGAQQDEDGEAGRSEADTEDKEVTPDPKGKGKYKVTPRRRRD